MTIYTGKLLEKDEGKVLDPQVVTDPLLLSMVVKLESVAENDNHVNDAAAGPPVVVTVMSRRRRGARANVCMLLTALVVLATGILGGIYLYKSLSHRQTFEGWCQIPYFEKEELENMRQQAEAMSSRSSHFRRRYGQFEEHIEIDKLDGRYEYIEVPEFEISAPATVVHDFDKNVTAIVDKTRYTCFLMPLNRTVIMPPRDHWDLLGKLISGYYMPDVEVVRERYRVIHPKLDDLSSHGYYVWRQCHLFDTYTLEKIGRDDPIAMVKRSVSEVAGNGGSRQFAIPGGQSYMPVVTVEGM